MSPAALVSLLAVVQLAGACLAIYRLLAEGIFRRYQFFFAYLLFRIPDLTFIFFLDSKSPNYFYFWIFTTPVNWLLSVLVVRELYGLVLARHRGLYTLGRWAMYAGIAIAVGISMLNLLHRFKVGTNQRSRIIGYFYAADQGVDLSLAIFLILMLLLLSQYFSVLSRNVVVHAILFAAWFLCNSIGSILRSTFGFKQYASIETFRLAALAICGMGWFLFMRAKGEGVRQFLPTLELSHEKKVMDQLDALNETLLRTGKK